MKNKKKKSMLFAALQNNSLCGSPNWAWWCATWGHIKSFCAPGACCVLRSQQNYAGLDVSKQMHVLPNALSLFIMAFTTVTRKITRAAYCVLFWCVSAQWIHGSGCSPVSVSQRCVFVAKKGTSLFHGSVLSWCIKHCLTYSLFTIQRRKSFTEYVKIRALGNHNPCVLSSVEQR